MKQPHNLKKNHKNIIVMKADKSNNKVVLDTNTYMNKMKNYIMTLIYTW